MQNDSVGEVELNSASEREGARRAALIVVGLVGFVLVYRLTALIDLRLSTPRIVVYGASGALFGALCGALQRADELEDRLLHTITGAVVLGGVFALFSLGGLELGPRKYRFS